MIRFHHIVLCLSVSACGTNPSVPAAHPARGTRVVEIDQWITSARIAYQVTIREASSPVQGAMSVYSTAGNREGVAVGYGCEMKPLGDPGNSWGCDVPFVRGQPDWPAVLARLDRLGVMSPPKDSAWAQRGQGKMLCRGGTPWRMVIWDSSADTLAKDAQVCGPKSPERARYEGQVEALLGDIARQARVR